MVALALPVLITLFAWWFATGLVLILNGLPRARHGEIMAGASLVALLGFAAILFTRQDGSVLGAYLAFLGALAIWAWCEIGFLLGHITGSNRAPCPEGVRGWPRFVLAARSVLHHEVAIFLSVIAILVATMEAENATARLTYLVLWLMRLSAKFNIFFGVPNVTVEFLPARLNYLASYFTIRSMNPFFPISITLSTIAAALLFFEASALPPDGGAATGLCLAGTLLALAIVEHWFLVIPIPFGRLWAWGLTIRARLSGENPPASRETSKKRALRLAQIVSGGSGR